MKQDENVKRWLVELEKADPGMSEIILALRQSVFDNHPNAHEKIMYGGIVFSLDSEMFGGLFAYKNHVSLEFSNGYLMEDEKGILEGKGKYRRHIKFNLLEDIEMKDAKYYIKQARKDH